MLDAAPLLVEDDARQRDQRRADLDIERLGDVWRGEHGAGLLSCARDGDPRTLEERQQRPRGELGLRIGEPDRLGHTRRKIGEGLAVDQAHADGALHALAAAQIDGRGDMGRRLVVAEGQEPHNRRFRHRRDIGEHVSEIGDHRLWLIARRAKFPGALLPEYQPFALELRERAAYRHP